MIRVDNTGGYSHHHQYFSTLKILACARIDTRTRTITYTHPPPHLGDVANSRLATAKQTTEHHLHGSGLGSTALRHSVRPLKFVRGTETLNTTSTHVRINEWTYQGSAWPLRAEARGQRCTWAGARGEGRRRSDAEGQQDFPLSLSIHFRDTRGTGPECTGDFQTRRRIDSLQAGRDQDRRMYKEGNPGGREVAAL